MIVKLAGRERELAEPVFKVLKKILTAYNSLSSNATESEKLIALQTLLDCLTAGKVKLRQLKKGELDALINAIPTLCHLKPAPEKGGKLEINWGEIYIHLSVSCPGWTYDYIDNNMTLSRLEECQDYFKKFPPTHQMVAAYLGYEPENKQQGSSFLAALAAQVKAANPSQAS